MAKHPHSPSVRPIPKGLKLNRSVQKLWRLRNTAVQRNEWSLLPFDLTIPILDALLDEAAALANARLSAAKAGKQVRKAESNLNPQATRALRALTRYVNSNYPPGRDGRADFFPAGNLDRAASRAERLLAFASGLTLHADGRLPASQQPAALEKLAKALQDAEREAESHSAAHRSNVETRGTVDARIRDAVRRVSDGIKSFLGEENGALKDYGLKPRAPPRPRRRRKKKEGAQPAKKGKSDPKKGSDGGSGGDGKSPPSGSDPKKGGA